jgi:hypothetical protein
MKVDACRMFIAAGSRIGVMKGDGCLVFIVSQFGNCGDEGLWMSIVGCEGFYGQMSSRLTPVYWFTHAMVWCQD